MEKKIEFFGIEKKIVHHRKVLIFNCQSAFDDASFFKNENIKFQKISNLDSQFIKKSINQVFDFEPDVIVWDMRQPDLTLVNTNLVDIVNHRFPGPFKYLVMKDPLLYKGDRGNFDFWLTDFNDSILKNMIDIEDLRNFGDFLN